MRDNVILDEDEICKEYLEGGKREFNGCSNYDEVLHYIFDLETEGLDPSMHTISQIGLRTNKGYERIIKVTDSGEESLLSELSAETQERR